MVKPDVLMFWFWGVTAALFASSAALAFIAYLRTYERRRFLLTVIMASFAMSMLFNSIIRSGYSPWPPVTLIVFTRSGMGLAAIFSLLYCIDVSAEALSISSPIAWLVNPLESYYRDREAKRYGRIERA